MRGQTFVMLPYIDFLNQLDKKLDVYQKLQSDYIHCKAGCSTCCEKGDYPISQIELEYLMQGYAALDNETKIQIQNNIRDIEKGGQCPFLIEQKCSIYPYRPIICRVHGLAYLFKDGVVKVPYCANEGKNYSDVYKNGEIFVEPIKENLDTASILKDFGAIEIRNLYDWLKNS